MKSKSFNYYGFDKETFDSVAELRRQTNRNNIESISILFLLVMAASTIMSFLNVIPYAERFTFILFLVLSAAFSVFLIVFRKHTMRLSGVLIYAIIALMISFSIKSSVDEAFLVSAVFPAFVIILSMAFIDRMIPFSLVIAASYIVFVSSSYIKKPPSIARYDMIYGMVFTIVALFFHYRLQKNRIDQFLSYHKNLKIQRDLEIRSSFDALSKLLMRGRFFTMADSVLRSRTDTEYIAICVLDLDSFKQINDKLGHQMGDKAIQTAAETIWDTLGIDIEDEQWAFCERAITDNMSFAGRLGGDEFIILLREDGGWEATEKRLRSILDRLNAVELGELHGIHASFGVTEVAEGDRDIDAIYARADEALYEAKESGKNQIRKH